MFIDLSYSDGQSQRFTNVSCTGEEMRLIDCAFNVRDNNIHVCSPKRVGVRCHEERKFIKV